MNKIFNGGRLELKSDTGKNPLFWIVLFFSMLLKYGYYGFVYFPTVDDHNMYGVFSMMSPLDALLRYKMYTTRPLAVLLDTYVISRFWGNLWVILLAFTLMHFISCWLIYKIFQMNNLRTGAGLAVIFALLPLANDAAYWIAASSRIVAGLFFALLSFYLFMKYIEYTGTGNKIEGNADTSAGRSSKWRSCLYIAAFAVTNLISLGFYEQVIAFSFIGILALMVVNFKRFKFKWIVLIPLLNIAVLGAYYVKFSNTGNMASRGTLLKGDYIHHTINVYKRIKELMTTVPASQLKHGVINGANLLMNDKAVVYILLALAVSAVIGIFYAREDVNATVKKSIAKFLIGLFLIFLPFAPFFVIQLIWIVHRNTFISIIGMALVIESLADAFFGRFEPWSRFKGNDQKPSAAPRFPDLFLRILRGIAAGLIVFVFLLGNAAELHDYKNISEIDNEIVHNIAGTLEKVKGHDWNKYEAVIFNTKPIYITPTSRHFSNSTGSDWALTGAASSILRQHSISMLYPVADGKTLQMSREKFKQCTLIGMDDKRNTFPLKSEWKSGTELELKLVDGSLFGKVDISEEDIITFALEYIND